MSTLIKFLEVIPDSLSEVDRDNLAQWSASEVAKKARIVVSHRIAALVAEIGNAEVNIPDHPNQDQVKAEAMAEVKKLRNFLEILDGLQENRYTHKSKFQVNTL